MYTRNSRIILSTASTNYQVLKATSEEAKLPEKTLSKQPLMVYPIDLQLERDIATSHKLNDVSLSLSNK